MQELKDIPLVFFPWWIMVLYVIQHHLPIHSTVVRIEKIINNGIITEIRTYEGTGNTSENLVMKKIRE